MKSLSWMIIVNIALIALFPNWRDFLLGVLIGVSLVSAIVWLNSEKLLAYYLDKRYVDDEK